MMDRLDPGLVLQPCLEQSMKVLSFLFRTAIIISLILQLAPAAASAQEAIRYATEPVVVKLIVHDAIQPVTQEYLARGLRDANKRHANAVLISLGTPGGLLDSTRQIVSAIEGSEIPVIVYISPAGSRAGSAGFFLLEAADVAAMAPGTNAGAAHPVVRGGKPDATMKEKLENDTAAFLRSFVSRRGRNVVAAEGAVRSSKSYSDSEALTLNLIDLVASDDEALLRMLDGRSVRRFDGRTARLKLHGAKIETDAPTLRERLLSRLANPDLAVLLMITGGLLIYLEFNVPGTIVPGALGTLCLLLGAFGLNLLPLRHTAIALLLAAAVMILLETKFASHGILATAGTGCLVFGLATLVESPVAEQRVHLSTAIAAGIGFGAISFFLASIALRARHSKVLTGPEAMLRQLATAITPLEPSGQIEVRGELWQATLILPGANLPAGATVIVHAIDGLVLLVDAAGEPT